MSLTSISRTIALAFVLSALTPPGFAQKKVNPYMGDPVEQITARNGAVVSAGLERTRMSTGEPRVLEVRENVWSVRDASIVNCIIMETPEGLVVMDTGRNVGEGEAFLGYIRQVSQKPIIAIIYSHWHYTRGASALASAADGDPMIIGHPDVDRNYGSASIELAPSLQRRVNLQFGGYLPAAGPDARAAPPSVPMTDSARLAAGHLNVTRPVADGEEMTIGGMRFQFFHVQGDTADSLTVWMPELSAVATNTTSSAFFALYTLRGEPYRDPRRLIASYDLIRSLKPEFYVPVHGDPLAGRSAIHDRMTAHRDAYSFVYNQAVRGINQGWSPDQLVANTVLPDSLASYPSLHQGYAEVDHALRGIYRGEIGWFAEDTADLNPPDPSVLGAAIVSGFGGMDALLARSADAMGRREYALAAKLAGYGVHADPSSTPAKQAKADALRKMAQVAWGTQSRNFYLSEALHLEGKIDSYASVSSDSGSMRFESVAQVPSRQLVSVLESRIDPRRAGSSRVGLGVVMTRGSEAGETFHVLIRNGIAEVVTDVDANQIDAVLQVDRKGWFDIIAKNLTVTEVIASGGARMDQGTTRQYEEALSFFDAL